MDLFLDSTAPEPLSEQLFNQLKHAIASGRLLPGDRFTPSRQLADELHVSRHTVTTAYGRLVAEGYAEGRAGGGSVVAPAPAVVPQPSEPVSGLRPSRRFAGWTPIYPVPSPRYQFDLRPGLPDASLFPAEAWRRRVTGAMSTGTLEYGSPAGKSRLRRAIAGWVARSRSVTCTAEMILVTSGAQHAIDLVSRVLLDPMDVVAVEDPGYSAAARLFTALGASVASVPVDDQGLVVDLLPPAARIVYVTPSHQYPLGMTMSMARRRALLDWAQRHDAAIIEDDYDTEFRYVDRPLEPIHALDTAGRVIYVGSFSKTFSPSVRLGFAVIPPALTEPVTALRQLIDWHPPQATQGALAGFIEDGLLDRHIRRSRRVYGERHRLVIAQLSGKLSDHLTVRAPNAGLHIAAMLRPGLIERDVLRAAAARGIGTAGLRQFYRASPAQDGLLLGFGAVTTSDLSAALATLGKVLDEQSSTAGLR
jgi:GntR family transcriptional regulator / MocR family aminotransferase